MTPELGALPLAGIPELCGPYAKNVRKASALCRIYIPFFILDCGERRDFERPPVIDLHELAE